MELDTYDKLKHSGLPTGCYRNDSVSSTTDLLSTTKKNTFPDLFFRRRFCEMNMFVMFAFIGFAGLGVLVGTLMMSGVFGSDKLTSASAGANTGSQPTWDEEEFKMALDKLKALEIDMANFQSRFNNLEDLPGYNYMLNDTLLALMLGNYRKITILETDFDDMAATTDNLVTDAEEVEVRLNNNDEVMNELNVTQLLNTNKIGELEDELSVNEETIDQLDDIIINNVEQISQLRANEVQLNEEMTSLENSWESANILIEHNQDDIVYITNNVSSTILNINETVYDQIDIIKNMAGPQGANGSQGPTGASSDGSLAACEYHNATTSDDINVTDGIAATYVTPEGYAITGVYCSVYGGTEQRIEFESRDTIKCQCYGDPNSFYKPSDGRYYCTINVWLCPETPPSN